MGARALKSSPNQFIATLSIFRLTVSTDKEERQREEREREKRERVNSPKKPQTNIVWHQQFLNGL